MPVPPETNVTKNVASLGAEMALFGKPCQAHQPGPLLPALLVDP